MSAFREIRPEELSGNAIEMMSKKWALLTAKKGDKLNTMTIGWGGLGYVWGKPAAFVFVRPQRFTYGFVEAAEGFSLSFYDESHRQDLQYCGTVSGREEDKIAHCHFTPLEDEGIPYFAQADTVLLCKKLYAQDLKEECALDPAMLAAYPQRDFHRMYVAEIKKVLVRE